ncbi:methyl-accepting chemotaxis protein [Phycicoccus sp. MAQZ13P-2]|uniref:methyl-accepting chemotaxis protein n=1 Tax=Phycicoccus mangrovi TaxID=2840470 RepID=UPI001C004251|nr:methyl-accepting chemotaxis protein [Phycicoccus mangrovi]MBT9257432.1 methyl-accepting chemotaxis protein [Phycicoccus mangrovi]MBT9275694.1 methyl-accepting chemotaxis protein [Phycicoccus mangrovi]
MTTAHTTPTKSRGLTSTLLRPVLAVVRRMRLSTRMIALAAVLLVPTIVLGQSFLAASRADIAFAEKERTGVTLIRPAIEAMTELVAGRRPDLSGLQRAVGEHPELNADADLAKVSQLMAGADTPAGASAAVSALLELVNHVVDSSEIVLDPDIDSFHLADAITVQLPNALEHAAQARVARDGMPLEKGVAERALSAGGLEGHVEALTDDIETAVGDTDRTSLGQELEPLRQAGAAVTHLQNAILGDLEGAAALDASTVAAAAKTAVAPSLDALDELLAARSAALSRVQQTIVTISVVSLLLAFWLVIGVTVLTRREASSTVEAVRALAEGDLREQRLPDGRDEFGDIGRSLSTAVTTLREMITSISQDAVTLAAASEEVSVASASIASAAQHTSARAQTASGAAQEVYANIDSLSAASTQFGASISEISHNASEAARVAVTATDLARQTTSTVDRLGRSSAEISDVIALIRSVAEQTNLLALNATIEAARAGESGRGFAVVAGEVKELAQRTAAATADITDRVEQIQADGAAAAAAIGEITSVIEQINEF